MESAHAGMEGSPSIRPAQPPGKSLDDAPVRELTALLDKAPRRHDAILSQPAVVADDGARLDDTSAADVAAVDHRARADDDVIADDQTGVGQQVKDGILENLDPIADPDRTVAVTDDLDSRPDDATFPDDHVSRDFGRVE